MSNQSRHACHECGGHIDYPEETYGAAVNCPHCGRETTLGEIYPNASATPRAPAFGSSGPTRSRRTMGLVAALGGLMLGAGGILWALKGGKLGAAAEAAHERKPAEASSVSSLVAKPQTPAANPAPVEPTPKPTPQVPKPQRRYFRQHDDVVVWGSHGYDSRGDRFPKQLTDLNLIAAGANHLMAVRNGGAVEAWGSGSSGQLAVPAGLSGVTEIAGGGYATLALRNDGKVFAWGSFFKEGDKWPVPKGLSSVTAIAKGWEHALVVKSDGTVFAWGNGTFGQTRVPPGLRGVRALAAGMTHSVALKSDGTIISWGDNRRGQTAVPSGLREVVALSARGDHTLALRKDGTVVAWGWNRAGQTDVPAGLTGVVAIATGMAHSMALVKDGKNNGWVVVWGGDKRFEMWDVPNPVKEGVTAIAAGDYFCMAYLGNAKSIQPVQTFEP